MAERSGTRSKSGFTLIEVLVVVMIVGILTALAVPQYYKTLERDKAAEGIDLLLSLKGSQDRYFAKYGVYCNTTVAACVGLDVTPGALHYFNALPAFTTGTGNPSWKLALTRTNAPVPYGTYTLTFDSGAAPQLSCSVAACTLDLLPHP